jgi:hypothetical protein
MLTPLARAIDNPAKMQRKHQNYRAITVRLEIAARNAKGRSIFSGEHKELQNAVNAAKRARIHEGFIIRCLL